MHDVSLSRMKIVSVCWPVAESFVVVLLLTVKALCLSVAFFIRTHTWSKFIVLIHRAAPLLLQGVMHGPCKFNNSVLGCLGHLGLSH